MQSWVKKWWYCFVLRTQRIFLTIIYQILFCYTWLLSACGTELADECGTQQRMFWWISIRTRYQYRWVPCLFTISRMLCRRCRDSISSLSLPWNVLLCDTHFVCFDGSLTDASMSMYVLAIFTTQCLVLLCSASISCTRIADCCKELKSEHVSKCWNLFNPITHIRT